ncbi:MAG TPA: glycosyltransferase family 2 protein [Gemmatimonadales bacterium]|nr:glycosyltransferase family 2 protein [Gemmatimonadales bacterium]
MISIVIVTFNSVPEVLACLASIEHCAARIPHEVIVVDNASSDGTIAALRERFPAVRLVANEENVGFPRANNQALPLVRGEYIFFLNPDSELQPGALDLLLTELDDAPGRAAVGPRVRKPSEFASRTCARRLPTLWTEFCDLLWLDRIFLHSRIFAWKYYEPWDRATDRDVECLLGAAMLCRTAQIRALGGFDESVPLYLDDMDLCNRLGGGELGRLHYVSGAEVLHHYSVSTRKQATPLIKRLGLQATYLYFRKAKGGAYARAYVATVALAGIVAFPLGLLRLLGGSLEKARRRWDEARVFVGWAWRSKAVTYTLPRLP